MTKFGRTILICAILTVALAAVREARAGLLRVNTSDDAENCDAVLSLREAIDIAQGNLLVVNDSVRTQIYDTSGMGVVPWTGPPPAGCTLAQGPFWWVTTARNTFTTIVFFIENGNTTISLTSPLSDLRYTDGEINGKNFDGSIIAIDGRAAGASAVGISLGNHRFNILNMEIRNFTGDGLLCDSCDNSVFRGLDIHNNGGSGIHFITSSSTYGNPQNDTIGGTGSDQGNVIFSNGGDGINITANLNYDRANENILILNNLIGTADGTTAAGNSRGISLSNVWGATIGDASGLTKNVISGNNVDGITISGSGSVSNAIYWNNIGTDLNGNTRLGNGASGVAFLADAGDGADLVNSFQNIVGKPGFPNLISANSTGVFIADTNTSNNIVQNNYIGTGNGANNDLGNTNYGVYFANGTYDNRVGGAPSAANVIAFNGTGIFVNGGVRNNLENNRMFLNHAMGIDLAPAGVTPNDVGDADTGPNNLQNYPVITFVKAFDGSLTIQGTFNSKPNSGFAVDFFGNDGLNASGHAEGRYFIGTRGVDTDANGNATFNFNFPVSLSVPGRWITATATDSQNNTSEYSRPRNICADAVLSPSSVLAFSNGGPTTFTITMSAGCSYSVISSVPWIYVNTVQAATAYITINPNPGPSRNGNVGVFYNNGEIGTFVNFFVSQGGGARRAAFDYDGDGKSDVSVYRPGNNSWYVNRSQRGFTGYQFGAPGDVLVPADYTGDGLTDIAIWRPSNASWYILRSEDSTLQFGGGFGTNGDIPAPGDFDGDGKADLAVFRPSTGTWYIQQSTAGFKAVQFGLSEDKPAVGDYDGDGKADISVYRPSLGNWYRYNSSTGAFFGAHFGTVGDMIVPADYTGDGKTDLAVYRPSSGTWYIMKSEDNSFYSVPFGISTDIPEPGDYDGDGKADPAVFRVGTGIHYLQQSTAGFSAIQFGQNGDRPTESSYVY